MDLFFEPDDFREAAHSLDQRGENTELVALLGYNAGDMPVQKQKKLSKLLEIAARSNLVFATSPPHLRRASIFGAQFRSSSFGLSDSFTANASGRGLRLSEAFESCMGEAAEVLSFHEIEGDDPLIDSGIGLSELNEDQKSWVLRGLGASIEREAATDTVTCTRLGKPTSLSFPVELILRRPENRQNSMSQATSTGLGAGAIAADAMQRALLEIVERDAVALWWFAGSPAQRLSDKSVESSGLAGLARSFGRTKPARPWWILDITSDLGIPVAIAASCKNDGSSVVIGASASGTFRHAMFGAFLELCQMELAQAISMTRAHRNDGVGLGEKDGEWIARHEMIRVSRYPQLYPTSEIEPHQTPSRSEYTDLQGLDRQLEEVGYPAYYVDLTRPNVGVPVARCLVPGLQSMDMCWKTPRLNEVAARHLRNAIIDDDQIAIM